MSTWRDSAPFSGRRNRRASLQWRRGQGRGRRSVLLLGAFAIVLGAATAVIVELDATHHRTTARSAQALSSGASVRAPALGTSAASASAPSALASQPARSPSATAQAKRIAEVRDPEEARSFPVSPGVRARYHNAATPSRAADAFVAPGALTTSQVREELAHLQALEREARSAQATLPGGDSVGGNGTIPVPPNVPTTVQRVIAAANVITDLPYVYGGGHASFVDNAYDCSGSVSYALAAGGLLSAPETSGALESWGAPGPGNWITVFANEGHVYMYVNVGGAWMRYDTVGRSGPFASRWQPSARSNEGFVARHWPGL